MFSLPRTDRADRAGGAIDAFLSALPKTSEVVKTSEVPAWYNAGMSYRAFKRLLGETSLERKCRFLFGAGILLLITISFWFYACQTEDLAYNQATVTCRHLVGPVLDKRHLAKDVLEAASVFD